MKQNPGIPEQWYWEIEDFPSNAYLIGDVQSRVKGDWCDPYENRNSKSLIVQFSDGNENILIDSKVNSNPLRAIAIPADYTAYYFDRNPADLSLSSTAPAWKMNASACYGVVNGVGIFRERSFKLIVGIEPDNLKNIKKVALRLED